VACEFKRAGFPEGKAIGTSLPIGLQTTLVNTHAPAHFSRDFEIRQRWRFSTGPRANPDKVGAGTHRANSAVGLPVSHIQENRPV